MLTERYLELLKSALVNELYIELEAQLLFSVLCSAQQVVMDLPDFWATRRDAELLQALHEAKAEGNTVLLETPAADGKPRADGNLRNYTEFSCTLVGRKRLDHLQACVEQVLAEQVPGDLFEAGVWRGGCCILMRAVLAARGCTDRTVWVADSFQGLPPSRREEDRPYAMDVSRLPVMAVSEQEVRQYFQRFGLLDQQVRFVPGWFEESLPQLETGPLAVLRIDCDLYASTWTVLEQLYSRVSPGGWVVVDDYGSLPPCRQAVNAFRGERGITVPLEPVDDQAVCWRVT